MAELLFSELCLSTTEAEAHYIEKRIHAKEKANNKSRKHQPSVRHLRGDALRQHVLEPLPVRLFLKY